MDLQENLLKQIVPGAAVHPAAHQVRVHRRPVAPHQLGERALFTLQVAPQESAFFEVDHLRRSRLLGGHGSTPGDLDLREHTPPYSQHPGRFQTTGN